MTRRVGVWGLCLALGGALGVSGCSALHANRIPKVPLASLPLTTIKVDMPNGGTLAPGKKGQLVVTLTDSAGKVYSTNGKGEGKAKGEKGEAKPKGEAKSKGEGKPKGEAKPQGEEKK